MKFAQKEDRLRCPECKRKRLEPLDSDGTEIDACINCGGLWFDHNELNRCIHSFDENFEGAEGTLPSNMGFDLGETNLSCPHCAKKLHRIQYSKELDLTSDLCLSCHGIWLEKKQFELIKHAHLATARKESIDKKVSIKSRVFQFFTQLPVEFNIAPHRIPKVVYSLIFLNFLFFLLMPIIGTSEVIRNYAFTPSRMELTTLFTSMFLHGGIAHLLGNMYFLWKMGDNVEDALGHKGFLVFYLLTGLCGTLLHLAFNWGSFTPMVGASGAISGVMGGYLVFFRKAKLTAMILIFQFKLPAWVWIGGWFALNLFSAMAGLGRVAWFAHIGGFVAGAIWSHLNYKRVVRRRPIIHLLNHRSLA